MSAPARRTIKRKRRIGDNIENYDKREPPKGLSLFAKSLLTEETNDIII